MTHDGVFRRYRWIDGRIEEKTFFRESKSRYHWVDEKTGLHHKCMKSGWYTTKAEAARARVEYCDHAAELSRAAARKWQEEGKVAFLVMINELAGRHEYEYVERGGAGDGGGAGGGGVEGEVGQAPQGADDRTGGIG